MVSLPDGEKISKIIFIRFDVIHERDGTDGQTDGQTLHDSKDHAYASHRAVKRKTLEDTA